MPGGAVGSGASVGPLRRGLLRGINGHAAGRWDYLIGGGYCLARVMPVAADSATAPAPLLARVVAVPSSPSETKGEEGT